MQTSLMSATFLVGDLDSDTLLDYTQPHSCEHCAAIEIFRKDDFEIDQASLERSLLDLWKPASDRERTLAKLMAKRYLQGSSIWCFTGEQLLKGVSDGCLFCEFVHTGVRNRAGRDFERPIPIYLISIITENNTVKIRVFHDLGALDQESALPANSVESADRGRNMSMRYHNNWNLYMAADFISLYIQSGRIILTFTPLRCFVVLWGGAQNVRTTKDNLMDLSNTGISSDLLPQTITDAITVTRELGLHYLWVDALCIVQDDDEDKSHEIESMASIYEGAVVTITASRAPTVQHGFLQRLPRYGLEEPRKVFTFVYEDDENNICPVVIAPVARNRVDYLSMRGWTLQERLLSKRILDFGSTCVSWACHSVVGCDRGCNLCSHESIFMVWTQGWNNIVTKYSRRSLTIAKDRLPAIAGIAKRSQRHPQDTYLAGIWRWSLPDGLLWCVDGDRNQCLRPDTYLAPSWSWASNLQAVVYWSNRCTAQQADILGAEVKHESNFSNFGCVSDGFINVRGFVTKVYWKYGKEKNSHGGNLVRLTTETPGRATLSSYIYKDAKETNLEVDYTGFIPSYLLILFSNRDASEVNGLVLYKDPDGKYLRLGVFESPFDSKHPVSHLLEGVKEEITII
ncbi:heterokaryon incompatibility protein-domain-containing protein [Cadophora sp. MPI-SDFR-AT-0126]|nr:heterokaryon incompatibility protein-domain-containing protein [Leotiomycetes sp. MPI-SDFR-AT-0126]